MIIQCKSCQKKFVVPDNAVTAKGRLVQCSSCGNKWTQYPIKQKTQKIVNVKNAPKASKKKTKRKKTSGIDVYSEEYLQKKHGIKIIDPSSSDIKTKKNSQSKTKKTDNAGYGFFNYLITFSVLSIFFVGILNFEKSRLSRKFPFLEPYIENFFETLNNFKIIFIDFITSY
ncbi:MAG: hypothetical protein CNC06_02215 [Pelagibacterales bacterium MED-G40]|nr:MAG: hypothetical protein CNC06_02215 [Pelagibacterales bacterium MED-G40]|tara:strand:- start:40940 stop:41452 length:513 start_codon:yes stop_codon:yes gene_type:complete